MRFRPRLKLLPPLIALLAILAVPALSGATDRGHQGEGHTVLKRAYAARLRTTVSTIVPAPGTVSGTIEWQVKVAGGAPSRVEFSVDGVVRSSDSSTPYVFPGGLDTRSLADGPHTLTATTYAARRRLASSSVSVNVQNSPPAPTPEAQAPPTEEPSPAPEENVTTPIVEEPGSAPQPQAGTQPSSILWGAWIGNQLTGKEAPWDMNAVTKFEQETGKGVSVVNFSAPFANCSSSPCSFYNFPTSEFNSIRSHGSIPFFSWGSQSIPLPSNLNEPDFQLSDLISGRYDSYLRNFATAAKNWGHPFFLRFNWEMNGNWFAWMEGVNGNQAGEYVAAWRHVHDIFTEVGATNATWVWCPNVDPEHRFKNLRSLYPGNQYVDWTGLDGYNAGTDPSNPDRWRSFDQLYSSTYREITEEIAPAKPMIVSEVGSSEYGGSKATWIREMLSTIPVDYPKIRGVLWFDKYEGGMDWPIESSTSATSAFAAGIQSPVYTANEFGSLPFGPVQPPG